MSYMIRNEYDKALEYYNEAAKLRPGDIVSSAIHDCKYAKRLVMSMQQVEDNALLDAEKTQAATNKAAQSEIASTITNKDIIELTL